MHRTLRNSAPFIAQPRAKRNEGGLQILAEAVLAIGMPMVQPIRCDHVPGLHPFALPKCPLHVEHD